MNILHPYNLLGIIYSPSTTLSTLSYPDHKHLQILSSQYDKVN
ncbi:hypothetical protein SAMN02745165_02879 [Malonomonas rubra DSM 5091]|uniref:Uncharacterized protein n=1 Tax=Malonomonas rubra DSM 5091 TaxID=1122189 RepID=A0A1M6L5M2_MALRU|nr:hypothetical protein SAMN02745165_02879 [Malonomonas rubra DSM 5091]